MASRLLNGRSVGSATTWELVASCWPKRNRCAGSRWRFRTKRSAASSMKILALEFSSPRRSVAAMNSLEGTAHEVVASGPGATRWDEMMGAALREAKLEREQIECVAVGIGPGSYTGIRTAIA